MSYIVNSALDPGPPLRRPRISFPPPLPHRLAGLYRVPTLDPSRPPRRPRISFPPPLPPPSHLPAGPREKFRRTQAHVPLGPPHCRTQGPGRRGGKGGGGDLGGGR